MNKRDQYHEALNELFDTLGWRCLMEDLENQVESARLQFQSAKSWHDVGVLKGRIQAYTDVLVLPQNITAQVETIVEDQDDADLQL